MKRLEKNKKITQKFSVFEMTPSHSNQTIQNVSHNKQILNMADALARNNSEITKLSLLKQIYISTAWIVCSQA